MKVKFNFKIITVFELESSLLTMETASWQNIRNTRFFFFPLWRGQMSSNRSLWKDQGRQSSSTAETISPYTTTCYHMIEVLYLGHMIINKSSPWQPVKARRWGWKQVGPFCWSYFVKLLNPKCANVTDSGSFSGFAAIYLSTFKELL